MVFFPKSAAVSNHHGGGLLNFRWRLFDFGLEAFRPDDEVLSKSHKIFTPPAGSFFCPIDRQFLSMQLHFSKKLSVFAPCPEPTKTKWPNNWP